MSETFGRLLKVDEDLTNLKTRVYKTVMHSLSEIEEITEMLKSGKEDDVEGAVKRLANLKDSVSVLKGYSQ